MLDVIQDIYTFLPDMPDEPENESYLKYIAPLSYNSSLNVSKKKFFPIFFCWQTPSAGHMF